ncbi:MAG: FecR domain-containing protein [Patescibacteria group bacterium]
MSYTYYRRYQPRNNKRRSNFRSFFWLVIILVLLALGVRACVSVISKISNEKRDEATLTVTSGSAEVTLWGEDEAKEAASAQLILEGVTLHTLNDSQAVLRLHNGTEVTLDENSKLIYESFEGEDDEEQVVLGLLQGQGWVEHLPMETGTFTLTLENDLMDIISTASTFWAGHRAQETYVYNVEGQSTVHFVDRRASEAVVVEETVLNPGNKSLFDEEKTTLFLARQSVVLSEPMSEDEFHPQWLSGQRSGTGEVIEDEEALLEEEEETDVEAEAPTEEVEEETPKEEEEPVAINALKITVDAPTSGATLTDAFAIEGRILEGTASRVTVTWSGTGVPYALGYFQEGEGSFRYVADPEYRNFSAGENTYTVVAYDSDGNISNTVVLVVNGEF